MTRSSKYWCLKHLSKDSRTWNKLSKRALKEYNEDKRLIKKLKVKS